MMAKALSLVAKISVTFSLKEKLKERSFLDPEADTESREERLEFLRKYTATEYHPIGVVRWKRRARARWMRG